VSTIRRLAALLFYWIIAVGAQGTAAEPQWLTLPPPPILPETTQSGIAAVNGIKIWYASFGDGEPVILLHGGR
jgi:hypothetical protein